jgi:hypothetical protein
MHHVHLIVFVICVIVLGAERSICLADDLDDGIPIDDHISEYDQIGDSIDKNYSYIALRVQSDAAVRSSEMANEQYMTEGSVLNSVILQAGAKVRGDIIIIDQSKGDKTIIAH